MPIVFDTGASMSVSIADLNKPKFPSLKVLKGEIKVIGEGTVDLRR
jgi:hypothetical protein